jgi:hypothetical protein
MLHEQTKQKVGNLQKNSKKSGEKTIEKGNLKLRHARCILQPIARLHLRHISALDTMHSDPSFDHHIIIM